jgi:phospholipid/cholesterol/gamma-HCH transport system substrate-binding protein
METKANYVLIGAFTLLGILGALGLLLWLAKVEVDRQYSYFDVLFDDVSGLGSASDVRYNGLPVGQVVGLELDDDVAGMVRVRIEVRADTPVNSDTKAQLQSQGVTGVSFVGLSGGDENSEPLPSFSEIPSERTALQSVFEGAPVVLERTVALLENVNDVFNDANKEAVGTLVSNLATSSERLDGVLANFETLSDDLGNAAREIAAFTDRLGQLSESAEGTLATATTALETANGTLANFETFTTENLVPLSDDLRETSQTATRVLDDAGAEIERLSTRIDQLADSGATVLDSANTTIASVNTLMQSEITPLARDVRTTANTATQAINDVSAQSQRIADRFAGLADSGVAALDTATVTFNEAQGAIKSVDQAAAGFDLFTTDRLVPLTDDLRATSQTADRVIEDVGVRTATLVTRLDTLADEGSAAIATFTDVFNNANETLEWVTTAMTGATETLDLASQTFASANKVIRDDIGGIITDLRTAASTFATTFSGSSDGVIVDLRKAADTFTVAVTNASRNIDTISGEVLAASQSAAKFAGSLETVVSGNQRQLSEFLRLGLPEFLRFTEEARGLVINLERLVNKLERDPARFLLGTQNSEFRR